MKLVHETDFLFRNVNIQRIPQRAATYTANCFIFLATVCFLYLFPSDSFCFCLRRQHFPTEISEFHSQRFAWKQLWDIFLSSFPPKPSNKHRQRHEPKKLLSVYSYLVFQLMRKRLTEEYDLITCSTVRSFESHELQHSFFSPMSSYVPGLLWSLCLLKWNSLIMWYQLSITFSVLVVLFWLSLPASFPLSVCWWHGWGITEGNWYRLVQMLKGALCARQSVRNQRPGNKDELCDPITTWSQGFSSYSGWWDLS